MNVHFFVPVAASLLLLGACQSGDRSKKSAPASSADTVSTGSEAVTLPAPFATENATKFSDVIGWPAGKTPSAPAGFTVSRFAGDLQNPRWVYIGPNGDVFIAEASTEKGIVKKVKDEISGKADANTKKGSADRITLLRDADGDGTPEVRGIFLENLNQPFGMLVLGNSFYVANTDGILQYPYQPGQTKITAAGKKILSLPAGGYNNHWTRNLFASKDGKKIYVAVGSASNVGEHGMKEEERRACILEINPDGTGERIFASGLRNPQGMAYAPGTTTLWTAVNERDGLGDDLVPDYITSVQEGGFYGWPYAYWGAHEDPQFEGDKRPDLVQKSKVPEVDMGAHTASLGLAFDEKGALSGKWAGGAFVGQHGSWNRSELVGYQVAFVPFRNGKPSGKKEPFLTGFIADTASGKVYGRPVGVAFTAKGTLLVTDDAGNTVWQVKSTKW
ncbi:sorbosone dehydrogenase family protein [Paraflavisolibacter sp. H34]|uniref:PQQ-dependent sugar dehydrogenase n=1 Tax=Huijunlia imazamoxiresistens TaxID=3127457 RepID=UPI003018B178